MSRCFTSVPASRGRVLAACLALCLVPWAIEDAKATRLGDMPPPTAQAVRHAASAVAASASPASPDVGDRHRLRYGVISTVDFVRERIQVEGAWLRIAAGQTRVVREGRVAETSSLAVGQQIRFTLITDAVGAQTLGLVYAP